MWNRWDQTYMSMDIYSDCWYLKQLILKIQIVDCNNWFLARCRGGHLSHRISCVVGVQLETSRQSRISAQIMSTSIQDPLTKSFFIRQDYYYDNRRKTWKERITRNPNHHLNRFFHAYNSQSSFPNIKTISNLRLKIEKCLIPNTAIFHLILFYLSWVDDVKIVNYNHNYH